MSITNGPNLGLMVNGNAGEAHYSQFVGLLRGLDGLVMPRVTGYLINTPPATPADGDCYIIGAAPTGVWAGQGGKVTRYSTVTAAWEYYTPKNGWTVESASARESYRYTAGAWEIFTAVNKAGDTGLGNMGMAVLTALGIKTITSAVQAGANSLWIDFPTTIGRLTTIGPNLTTFAGFELDQYSSDLSLFRNPFRINTDGSVVVTTPFTATTGTFSDALSPGTKTVATLPAGTNSAMIYATNGRKAGEGAGLGTGVLAIYTNGAWRDPSQAYAVVVA